MNILENLIRAGIKKKKIVKNISKENMKNIYFKAKDHIKKKLKKENNKWKIMLIEDRNIIAVPT